MAQEIKLTPPLNAEIVKNLHIGNEILISGVIFTARDAAHKKLVELLEQGEPLPFDLEGAIIYYCGPAPAKPGQVIGSAGPTTSSRMDSYTPLLLKHSLKAMIGKGSRSAEVRKAIAEHGAVYLVAVGGAGALLAQRIKKAEIIAYPELGPEAIYPLEVEDFPTIVANDASGRDLFEEGQRKYQR